jgi:hypothetical protein
LSLPGSIVLALLLEDDPLRLVQALPHACHAARHVAELGARIHLLHLLLRFAEEVGVRGPRNILWISFRPKFNKIDKLIWAEKALFRIEEAKKFGRSCIIKLYGGDQSFVIVNNN